MTKKEIFKIYKTFQKALHKLIKENSQNTKTF